MKRVILCADDYALDASVTRGILALLESERLSATSVMVLSPRWARDAVRLREHRGRAGIGLHLDWTSPFARMYGHGRSLAAMMTLAVLRLLDRTKMREVIERQLDVFEAHWQAPPDHIDGHQHVQQFPVIRDAVVDIVARRYPQRRPWLRVSRDYARPAMKSRLIAALGADALERRARAHGLPYAPALGGIYDFDLSVADYAVRMREWLSSAPDGAVIMCHPADGEVDPGEAVDEVADARRREYAHLASDAFPHSLQSAGVALVR